MSWCSVIELPTSGVTGPPGPIGITGEKGPVGDKGPKGNDGIVPCTVPLKFAKSFVVSDTVSYPELRITASELGVAKTDYSHSGCIGIPRINANGAPVYDCDICWRLYVKIGITYYWSNPKVLGNFPKWNLLSFYLYTRIKQYWDGGDFVLIKTDGSDFAKNWMPRTTFPIDEYRVVIIG